MFTHSVKMALLMLMAITSTKSKVCTHFNIEICKQRVPAKPADESRTPLCEWYSKYMNCWEPLEHCHNTIEQNVKTVRGNQKELVCVVPAGCDELGLNNCYDTITLTDHSVKEYCKYLRQRLKCFEPLKSTCGDDLKSQMTQQIALSAVYACDEPKCDSVRLTKCNLLFEKLFDQEGNLHCEFVIPYLNCSAKLDCGAKQKEIREKVRTKHLPRCGGPKCDHERWKKCSDMIPNLVNKEKILQCKFVRPYLDCAANLDCGANQKEFYKKAKEAGLTQCGLRDLPKGCDAKKLDHCTIDMKMPNDEDPIEIRCNDNVKLADCLSTLNCGEEYKKDAAGLREKINKMGCSGLNNTANSGVVFGEAYILTLILSATFALRVLSFK